jgi:hypothetical protein
MNRIQRPIRPDVCCTGESLFDPTVLRLARTIHDPRNLSEDYVRGIRALEATRHEDAAPIIADFLDMPGPVGDEAVRALVSLARCGGGRCTRAVVADCCLRVWTSLDDDEIRNAHRVLAALGSDASRRALAADCWADAEEEEALRRAA